MIKIHYCKVCKGWLVQHLDQYLYERDVYTAEEIGQLLGGN